VAGSVQGGSWIYLCGDAQWLGANDICVDGSQLGVDNEYSVTYYDINGNELNDPLGRNFKITVPRAPRSNADAEADAAHMNRFIEHEILKQPAQYLWVHRRFKTRPPGQSRFY